MEKHDMTDKNLETKATPVAVSEERADLAKMAELEKKKNLPDKRLVEAAKKGLGINTTAERLDVDEITAVFDRKMAERELSKAEFKKEKVIVAIFWKYIEILLH